MNKLTFKVKGIYNVRNIDKGCCIRIYALLVFHPKNLSFKNKILKREGMEAIVVSKRYEDNVNFWLELTIVGDNSIRLDDNLTFTVHENN